MVALSALAQDAPGTDQCGDGVYWSKVAEFAIAGPASRVDRR